MIKVKFITADSTNIESRVAESLDKLYDSGEIEIINIQQSSTTNDNSMFPKITVSITYRIKN